MSHETDGRIFLFVLCLIALVIVWEHNIKLVSSSVFALALGMLVSFIWNSTTSAAFDFAPELFLYLLLPPILLNSAFKFKIASLRQNWLSSVTFATVGTFLSMLWIAWGLVVWSDVTPGVALIFASILAPTDTVATLALTRSVETDDKYIFEVLENESLMNDALSVVLVRLFTAMDDANRNLDKWVPFEIISLSLLCTLLAIMFGTGVAWLVNRFKMKDLTSHYLMALFVYTTCECLQVSGILGLFAYGAMVKPPPDFVKSVASFSTIIEAYVYLMLGLAFHTYNFESFGTSLMIFLACLVGRVLVVFLLGGCLKGLGRHKWTVKSLLFFSMCGVRGAISYALCLSLDSVFAKSTTFVVIVCSVFVFGTLQKCLFNMLL